MNERSNNHRNQVVRPAEPPRSAQRVIFREEARQHYIKNQEKVEMPRMISPRITSLLWVLAILLFIDGLIITFWPFIMQWR